MLGEERLERDGESLGVAQLAVDDDAVVERGARRLEELGSLAVAHPGGRDLGAADLETDELLAPPPPRDSVGSAGSDGRGRGSVTRSLGGSSVSTSPASHSFGLRLNEKSRL